MEDRTGRPGARTGLSITVTHLPPGTSKWNKVEHRLFSLISMNWRGRPLTSHEVVVDTIAATTTATGLTVQADLDTSSYPTGIKIPDRDMKALTDTGILQRHDFHGEWNYAIRPPNPDSPPHPNRTTLISHRPLAPWIRVVNPPVERAIRRRAPPRGEDAGIEPARLSACLTQASGKATGRAMTSTRELRRQTVMSRSLPIASANISR